MAYKQNSNPFKMSNSTPLKQTEKPTTKKTPMDLKVEAAIAAKQKNDSAKIEQLKKDTASQELDKSKKAAYRAKYLATEKQAVSDSTAVSNKLKLAGLPGAAAEMSNAKANETRATGSQSTKGSFQQIKQADGTYKQTWVSSGPKQMKKKC
jgi:hypothetical protein